MEIKLRQEIGKIKRPRVTIGDCNLGAYAVNELKRGPEDFTRVISEFDGEKYSDERWTGKNVLFRPGFPDPDIESLWEYNYNSIWTYERWSDVEEFKNSPLFANGQEKYNEPKQGGAQNGYFI